MSSVGGRTTGVINHAATTSIVNDLIDNAIYFGGHENLTNAFHRMLHGGNRIRENSLPVSILVSASSNMNTKELMPILEKLEASNRRICLILINVDENSKFSQILTNFYNSFPIIRVTHWDQLNKHIVKVMKYLLQVV